MPLLLLLLLPRMAKYMVANEFQHYHGEAVNPKHLSTWERCVFGLGLKVKGLRCYKLNGMYDDALQ
jgi:hypothetical protein